MSEIGRDLQAEPTEMIDDTVPFTVPTGYRVMTEEEAQKLTETLVEDQRAQWEIQEIVDNAVVAGEANNLMRNEFYYEFKGQGGVARGLSAKMYSHLATALGVTEITDERVYEKTETDHEFEVVVAMPDPNNPDNLLKRTGFSEEPILLKGIKDRFAKQKAYTKAFRNAALKLLPQDVVIATIYKLAKLVPVDWTPEQQGSLPPAKAQQLPPSAPPQQKQEAPKENPVDVARKHMFAKWNERKGTLLAMGITEDIFKEALYERYGVESRADMTESDYRNAASSLDVNGGFAKWIMALAPTADGGEGEEESEEDVPF